MAKSTVALKGNLAALLPNAQSSTIDYHYVSQGQMATVAKQQTLYQLSDFNDDVTGTASSETIFAYDGNDRVLAGGGNDVVDGGNGNDTLYGEVGNDDLRGGAGDDYLDGGAGLDVLAGGIGNDRYMMDGVDLIVETANEGMDTVMTNLADATIPTNVENLEFFVNLNAGPANFTGHGNAAANKMTGNMGSDTLYGGAGNDTLMGEGGNDQLYGEDGLDRLDGGAGADSMWGGAGSDTYVVDNVGDMVYEGYDNGTVDTVLTSLSSYTLPNWVERVTYTGTGNFHGTGNGLANVVTGNSGDDVLDGGDGDDTLVGFDGNDTLSGGSGADLMKGGKGNDVYTDVNVSDTVVEYADEGIDTIMQFATSLAIPDNVENVQVATGTFHQVIGNGLDNKITGNIGDELLSGGAGKDTIQGGDGNDYIDGGLDADLLMGGNGNDKLIGGAGDDSLYGNVGADVLEGGYGRDKLIGGADADRFVFSMQDQGFIDTVGDFQQGLDKIDLSAFDGNPAIAGDQALAFAFMGNFVGGGIGSVRYDFGAPGHINVYVDANGDGHTDVQIDVLGVPGYMAMSDFVF